MRKISTQSNSFIYIVTQYRFILLFIAVAVLFLPLIKPVSNAAPGFIYFLGRFHPLIIHFPVVLVFLALGFELFRRFRLFHVSPATLGVLLGIGLLGSIASVALGFMLYYTGEYVGDTMSQHMWGGIVLTAAIAIALYLFLSQRLSNSKVVDRCYLSSLILANVIVIYTSHHGGSLTHGSEYLTEYMPVLYETENTWEPKPVEKMLVYEDMIVPVLDRKCLSCHNENKAKGELIMTSYQDMMKGGESEHPTLKPGSAEESEMYRRVMLPLDDDDRMPPKGKVALTKDEITLMAWWIDKGADTTLKVQEASADQKIQPLLVNYLAELETQQRTRFLQKQSLEKLIQTVSEGAKNNYVARIDPYEEKAITLSMPFPPSTFGDNDLLAVQPLFPNITKASFIASNITDDAFYHIAQMTSLRELYLQQTQIKGPGLVHLTNLQNLKLLDVSKTNINDGHLLHILQFRALEDLYINETNISKEVVEAIQQNKPDLKIHLERGKLF
jgi:uncharacterized membrane protein